MKLKIIGTSHIAEQSIQEIKNYILAEKPEIIALELDAPRAAALLQGEKRKITLSEISQIGFKGYLFVKLGQYLQQKLGKMVDVAPGSEMKMALELAQREKLQMALIDQPIRTTLKNFSRALSWKEKMRFLGEILLSPFQGKKKLRELGLEEFDLRKVPQEKAVEKMMEQLKKSYPNIYKTLVEDRNKYMVKQLVKIMRNNPQKKILVVVGAGHKKGMEELLQKIDIIS